MSSKQECLIILLTGFSQENANPVSHLIKGKYYVSLFVLFILSFSLLKIRLAEYIETENVETITFLLKI